MSEKNQGYFEQSDSELSNDIEKNFNGKKLPF